jgi:excinuclease UvrABC ATPase subunit
LGLASTFKYSGSNCCSIEALTKKTLEIKNNLIKIFRNNGKYDTERIINCGAKEHNLKSIDLDIPHNKITVITGPGFKSRYIRHNICRRAEKYISPINLCKTVLDNLQNQM